MNEIRSAHAYTDSLKLGVQLITSLHTTQKYHNIRRTREDVCV